MKRNFISMSMRLPMQIEWDEDIYVVSCPPLDIVTQVERKKDAKAVLIDAISGFLITCYEMGTLDAVLKDCGFVMLDEDDKGKAQLQTQKKQYKEFVDVGVPFTIEEKKNNECLQCAQ